MPNAQCPMPNAQCPMPNAQCRLPIAHCAHCFLFQGRLDETQCCFYASSLVLALEHLHVKGFIYRDLKPENLLLDGRGFLKLADLGLAKHTQRAWTLVGTPEYVAPEVLRGEGATQAVDWWQLGVLIFEMLTGRLPFEADDDAELFIAIRRGEYEWPGADGKKIELPSATVKELVESLLRHALPGDSPAASRNNSAREEELCASPAGQRGRDVAAGLCRLGSGGRDASEVMDHPWFGGVDWAALAVGEVTVPFVPQVS